MKSVFFKFRWLGMLTALSILFLTLSISPDGEAAPVIDTFVDPRAVEGDDFGRSVAFVGTDILIGAPEDGDGPGIGGAAYLFDGNNGSLLQTFSNPITGGVEDFFGFAVSGFGSNVVIGAPLDNVVDLGGFGPAGAAYLMNRATGNLIREFTDASLLVSSLFGTSIATMGGNIFIGAPGQGSGAVFQFDGNTGDLLKTFVMPPSAGAPGNVRGFGNSIAVMGQNILATNGSGSSDPSLWLWPEHLCSMLTLPAQRLVISCKRL
jgi:hypothetical protein